MSVNGYGLLRGGYDIDDTKLDFIHPFLNFASERLGRKVTYEQMSTYHIGNALGIPAELANEILHDFYRTPEFENLPTVPGALSSLKHISSFSGVYDLTAREPSLKEITRRSLDREFIKQGVPIRDVHFCFHHHGGYGTEKKANVAKRLNLHFMVEDSPENCREIVEKGIRVFMLRRPWNAHIQPEGLLEVFDSWEPIADKISAMRTVYESALA